MMNKLYIAGALALIPFVASAQSAIDAGRFSQSDIRGTARFMAMGGAFGALGGDLSTLSQNPGGIGVYRKQEIGFTIDLDQQRATSTSFDSKTDTKQTKFYLNNIGGVASFATSGSVFRNFNLGFTYNRAASFNNRYKGVIPQLGNSLSNYFAGVANGAQVSEKELDTSDPYFDGVVPWSSILCYDSYLIYPTGDGEIPNWVGQWSQGLTTGAGAFDIEEKGAVNEYNIALGGNISDLVFWGMDFGITDFSYTMNALWQENLQNAAIDENFVNPDKPVNTNLVPGQSNWALANYYKVTGYGFNYKLGFIITPIPELRLGVAMHTPTWYSLKEDFMGSVTSRYGNETKTNTDYTNGGINGFNQYNYRSPWKFIFSAAGVIDGQFIISADYELSTPQKMKFSPYTGNNGGYYDDYYDDYYDWEYGYYAPSRAEFINPANNNVNDPYYWENKDIQTYYKTQSMVRIGAEYRVIPQFSLRAGFAYQTSPVKQEVKDNLVTVETAGTLPNYTLDNDSYYISFGVGYRYQKFYADLTYQYRHRSAEYHAYTPDPSTPAIPSPQSKLSLENNNIVLSMGFKF